MFTYIEVETAMAKLHGVNEKALSAFRGRISNLKRLGIVPSSGGRGKNITYGIYDVWSLAYYLELAEFGLDPATMKQLGSYSVRAFHDAMERADTSADDVFFAFYPNIMAGSFYADDESMPHYMRATHGMTQIDAPDLSAETIEKRLGAPNVGDGYVFGPSARRVALINVSMLKRQLNAVLPQRALAKA